MKHQTLAIFPARGGLFVFPQQQGSGFASLPRDFQWCYECNGVMSATSMWFVKSLLLTFDAVQTSGIESLHTTALTGLSLLFPRERQNLGFELLLLGQCW